MVPAKAALAPSVRLGRSIDVLPDLRIAMQKPEGAPREWHVLGTSADPVKKAKQVTPFTAWAIASPQSQQP